MAPASVRADPRSPPGEFDDLVDWFERFSTNLVLLEEYPCEEIGAATRAFVNAVREHMQSFAATLERLPSPLASLVPSRAILRSDHVWFSDSLEQLEWLERIVEGEDHGGHRQALGQYGRVLAEALRRHRTDERAYLRAVARSKGAPSS